MDYREARKLKVGDRLIIWAERGTVIETGCDAVKIKWDDEQIGVIHLRDMEDISRAKR